MKQKLKVGDKVLLQLGVADLKLAPQGLRRWDGCQFVISKVHLVTQNETTRIAYYELASCKSPMGVPYTILDEWVIPLR